MIKKILLSSLILLSFHINTYLLIVELDKDNNVQPLSQGIIFKHEKEILEILLRYTWPSCITSDLTDSEKKELLSPVAHAEKNFVRKKLQKVSKQLDVIFFPTTLYELFYIKNYIDFINESCSEGSFSPVKYYLNKAHDINEFLVNDLEIIESILNEDTTEIEKEIQNKKLKVSPVRYIQELIYDEYERCNEKIFNTIQSSNPVLYPNILEVHQQLITKLLNDFKRKHDSSSLELAIANNVENIKNNYIDSLVAIGKTGLSTEAKKHCPIFADWVSNPTGDSSILSYDEEIYSERYGLQHIINLLKEENSDFVLSKTIKLEYEAAQSNQGILFRGSESINIKGLKKDSKIIASSRIIGNKLTPEQQGLYSISFGNSLFAGAFFYIDAMAYDYISSYGGYALFIDKFQYVDNYNSNLFFISGLIPEMALFGAGVWFHSRSKPAIADKTKINRPIIGIVTGAVYEDLIKDPYGVFIVTRDPYRQAYLFSKYLSNNGKIINTTNFNNLAEEEKAALDILEAQREHAIINWFEIEAKNYKKKKEMKLKKIARTLDIAQAIFKEKKIESEKLIKHKKEFIVNALELIKAVANFK